ncbi:hypothetical protein [Amycolatopsis panacis]|uniref:hypothetical protein n=1 Tax=Amycolatopsis panacis TaxID=2340917 RepID=UPI001314AB27|nr:hypothetical protein [Amycolatopsis panacis]
MTDEDGKAGETRAARGRYRHMTPAMPICTCLAITAAIARGRGLDLIAKMRG